MNELNHTTLSAKIYSKECPRCHKDNLESSAFCWNCNYEFPDAVAHAQPSEGHGFSDFFVTLAMIIAFVVIVLIIIDVVR